MEQINEILETRKKYLLQLKDEKERELKQMPPGTLRICRHGNKTQYYHRNDPKDFSGVYIREKDIGLAQRLAQKDYDRKVLGSVEEELRAIEKYMNYYPAVCPENIYEKLHVERQKLIAPILESEERYIRNWEAVEYQGKDFYENGPEFYTAKGERVRSKSEMIIADMLYREGIPYRYEYPVCMKGWGSVYPDFTVLNVRERKEIYWEHLGMMDEASYAEKAVQKIELYERNGIFQGENLILTYETRKCPLNQKTLRHHIERYLK